MMKRRLTAAVLALLTAVSCLGGAFCTQGLSVHGAEVPACESYSGTNLDAQNYGNYTYPIDSYLVSTAQGYMRVQGNIRALSGSVLVESYDEDFNLTDRRIIAQDLPVFGGFYAASDGNYYLITGQNNPDEDASAAVIQITRYNQDWFRSGWCTLYGANTTYPFDGGTVRCADDGSHLLIHTAHEMFSDSNGLNHQANMTIEVDMDQFSISDSAWKVSNMGYGYISHSFNQFILLDGTHVVTLDQSDAMPAHTSRAAILSYYNTDYTTGTFVPDRSSRCTSISMFPFGSSIEEAGNETKAAFGGFYMSSTHYLAAGSSADQENYDQSETRNIFVTAVKRSPASTDEPTIHYITDYAEGEASASAPQFVQISSNRYLLLWTRENMVYYTLIDGMGQQIDDIYYMPGALSDCVPVVKGSAAVWYTWSEDQLDFYSISLRDISQYSRKTVNSGHDYEIVEPADAQGNVVLRCTKCGEEKATTVPTSLEYWWDVYKKGESPTGYSTRFPETMDADEYLFSHVFATDGEVQDITIEIVEGAEALVPRDPASKQINRYFDAATLDDESVPVTLRVYPTYNPAIAQDFTLTVAHDYTVTAHQPPTTEPGYVTYTCNGCGHVYTKELPPLTDLSEETVSVEIDDTYCIYDHTAQTPALTVMLEGEESPLEEGVDYVIDGYTDNIDAGTASVIISALDTSQYITGSRTAYFTIQPQDIAGAEMTALPAEGDPDRVFEPEVSVEDIQGYALTAGTDYSISYTLEEDKIYVSIGGIDNYSGTKTLALPVDYIDIGEAKAYFVQEIYRDDRAVYNGTAHEPEMYLEYGDLILEQDIDFTVSYADNVEAGTGMVHIEGIGAFRGSLDVSFDIYPLDIGETDGLTAVLEETEQIFDGTEKTPAVSLVWAQSGETVDPADYTVAYQQNIHAGTAAAVITGCRNFTGQILLPFEIMPREIDEAALVTEEPVYWNGTPVLPDIQLTYNGMTLLEETDYRLEGTDNIEPGIASLTITGQNDYTGAFSTSYEILPQPIADMTIALTQETFYYRENQPCEPGVLVKPAGGGVGDTLMEGVDYTLRYLDNDAPGTAAVEITGKGHYSGTVTLAFQIIECSHSYETTVVHAPTCAETGEAYSECTICGDSLYIVLARTEDHRFGDWTVDVPPTVEADGTEVQTCSICGRTNARPVPHLNPENPPVALLPVLSARAGETVTLSFGFEDIPYRAEQLTGVLVRLPLEGQALEALLTPVEESAAWHMADDHMLMSFARSSSTPFTLTETQSAGYTYRVREDAAEIAASLGLPLETDETGRYYACPLTVDTAYMPETTVDGEQLADYLGTGCTAQYVVRYADGTELTYLFDADEFLHQDGLLKIYLPEETTTTITTTTTTTTMTTTTTTTTTAATTTITAESSTTSATETAGSVTLSETQPTASEPEETTTAASTSATETTTAVQSTGSAVFSSTTESSRTTASTGTTHSTYPTYIFTLTIPGSETRSSIVTDTTTSSAVPTRTEQTETTTVRTQTESGTAAETTASVFASVTGTDTWTTPEQTTASAVSTQPRPTESGTVTTRSAPIYTIILTTSTQTTPDRGTVTIPTESTTTWHSEETEDSTVPASTASETRTTAASGTASTSGSDSAAETLTSDSTTRHQTTETTATETAATETVSSETTVSETDSSETTTAETTASETAPETQQSSTETDSSTQTQSTEQSTEATTETTASSATETEPEQDVLTISLLVSGTQFFYSDESFEIADLIYGDMSGENVTQLLSLEATPAELLAQAQAADPARHYYIGGVRVLWGGLDTGVRVPVAIVRRGDVTLDGKVDTDDAYEVLAAFSAAGAGLDYAFRAQANQDEPLLHDLCTFAGDIHRSDTEKALDTADAYLILTYFSRIGAGIGAGWDFIE